MREMQKIINQKNARNFAIQEIPFNMINREKFLAFLTFIKVFAFIILCEKYSRYRKMREMQYVRNGKYEKFWDMINPIYHK